MTYRVFSWLVIALPVCVCQSILNNTYHTLYVVRQTHRLPHLDENLNTVSNDFGITSDSLWNDYTRSLLPLPIIVGVVLIISVVAFQAALLCRFCFKCCNCSPKNLRASTNTYPSALNAARKIDRSRTCLIIFFFVFCFLVVVAQHGIFVGRLHISDAVHKFSDSIDALSVTASDLVDIGYDMDTSGESVEDKVDAAVPTCPQANNIYPYIETYDDAVGDYIDLMEPISGDSDNLDDYLHDVVLHNMKIAIWCMYAAIMGCVMIYLVAYACRSKTTMKVGIGLGEVMVILFTALCCAELIILESYDTIAYYATCNGTNPIVDPLSDAYTTVLLWNETITTLTEPGGDCEGNSYLISCYEDINDILGNLTMIAETAACPPIQDEWANIFNEAVCDSGFYGIFFTWSSQFTAIAFLFVLMVISSLLFKYFGLHWESTARDVTITQSEIVNPASSNFFLGEEVRGSEEYDRGLAMKHMQY